MLRHRIALTVAREYPLSADRSVYERLARATQAKDDAPVAQALARGDVTLVPNGTRVRILQTDMNLVLVQVTDGPRRGAMGWRPTNLVGP